MKKEEFKKLYETMNNKQLAEKLGVTEQTIINTAKKLNLKMKGKGNREKRSKIIIED